jgi:hypothetical protein
MVDMSDTKHFKTILVSNFVVQVSRVNSNRCAKTTKGPVVTSHGVEISKKTDGTFVLTAHAHQASMRSVEIY